MKKLVVMRSSGTAALEAKLTAAVNSVLVPLVERGRVKIVRDRAPSFSFALIKSADGKTTDVRNVRFKGYLSTWGSAAHTDRDGDYVVPGAFTETIPNFMRNPVLLVNHSYDTHSVVGVFTVVREDAKGLFVEAEMSNSPDEAIIDARSKVAEGTLRTLSMGGRFYYGEDAHAIVKVDLWEGSLVALPSNPECLINS